MCFQNLWPFHCFFWKASASKTCKIRRRHPKVFWICMDTWIKGPGHILTAQWLLENHWKKLGFHCFCHSCIRYWMRHSKCESESGPGFKVRMWHFMYLCVFSFRAFPKEYSNFESVNIITMFNRFKFKEVVKHVYGDAPKMFKCLKSNRLNLFCWSCHMGHWRVNTC